MNRLLFAVLTVVFFSQAVHANTIHSCRSKMKSSKKVRVCYVKITDSRVSIGDSVEVKNQFNYIVATGKVIKTKHKKRSSSYALILLSKTYKVVKSGYPVFVTNNDSIDYWTATKAPY